MCGIVGYIGEEQAAPILLNGLQKLEYRGYDSAGVAVYNDSGVHVVKSKGRLSVLDGILQGGKELPGTVGIGHTRWATHGAPSDVNSHPQVSDGGLFAVVHNGIIENYLYLKNHLIRRGVEFVSDTDTEVVAQMLEYYYKGDVLETIQKVISKVEGSYALGIICADCPDRIFAVRKDSPLIIGIGEGENYIASDVPAILSQSGETADTLAALRMAKSKGCRILSIVNVVGSTIANESDDVLYTWAGPEIAVASTKAYSTQLAVIYMIALYMAGQLGTVPEADMARYMADLQRLPDLAEAALADKETIQYFASRYFNAHDMYFIGRNVDYAASLEASLKLKEISYIHSEAYTAGELKHGPISLLEDGTLVIAIATYEKLFDKMMSNVREVKARGAVVLGITVRGKEEALKQETDYQFCVPDITDFMLPSLSILPLQLFAYYVASMKGCDIDKPRNLAKSVTVE